MKLIAQSDDYGITRGCAQGALHAINNGIIRNTGLFANMPWAKECCEWLKPYMDRIAFGIDLNASTGPSILGHASVPHLCHEDGQLFGSKENRALDTDENDHDHLALYKDELYREFTAQIERYIEIVGHRPDYIHNHAYGTKTTMEVTHELAVQYQCITTASFMEHEEVANAGMGWYQFGGDAQAQLKGDLAGYLTSDRGNMLSSGKEYGYLICHCGYADAPLFELSSFNTCRAMDAAAVTSETVKQWIIDQKIDLITFKDLPREWIEK